MGWSKIGAIVVSTDFVSSPSKASPVTVPLSGLTVAGGDLLRIAHTWGTTNITASMAMTDNAGTPNTYYKHPSPIWNSPLGQGSGVFAAPILNVTSLTQLSFSWTGANIAFVGWIIEQFRHSSGALPSGSPYTGTPVSNAQASGNTGTDGVTSGTTTPAVNGALVAASVMFPNGFGGTFAQGTGYTLGTNDTGTTLQATEWLEQATAAAIAGTFTINTVQDTQTFVTAFAPPTGGGGGLTVDEGEYAPPVPQPLETTILIF